MRQERDFLKARQNYWQQRQCATMNGRVAPVESAASDRDSVTQLAEVETVELLKWMTEPNDEVFG